jgi:ATP-dependent Clp protease ATP-binding subunit ClpA
MFERFTDRSRHVLVLAQEEARLLQHNFTGTEQLFLGLTHEGEGTAAKALESLGISLRSMCSRSSPERLSPQRTSQRSRRSENGSKPEQKISEA